MKITDVRALSLSRKHEPEREWYSASFHVYKADCSILIIETDEGIQGIGEPSAYGVPPDIAAKVEEIGPMLLGRDPTEPGLMSAIMGERSMDTTYAGLDCALWDLKGKIAEKPVAQLLAGSERKPLEKVRLYASAGVRYDWDKEPESIVEEACSFAEMGLTTYKMRIGTDWKWSGVTVDRFLQLARKVYEAVGARMQPALDANCRLEVDQALEVAAALDEMGWAWFEEPTARDPEVWKRINDSVEMPISGCEPFTMIAQFGPYLERKSVDIVQPDAGVCGISTCMKVGAQAHEQGILLIPHNWHNGLMTMANAHMVAALPEPRFCELNMMQGPLQWDILAEKPVIEDGFLVLPDKPGLGVELAEDLEERFPYIDAPWGVRMER